MFYDYTGLNVTLKCEATLNELAALDTGRPGFENDVRLEFSNDADSNGKGETGFTPWDTVVCFTFEVDGLKTNNHDKVLQDAKFRLYSDKECKNEVYVKKNPNQGQGGYVVMSAESSPMMQTPPERERQALHHGIRLSALPLKWTD